MRYLVAIVLTGLGVLAFVNFAIFWSPTPTQYKMSRVVQQTGSREFTVKLPKVDDDGKVTYEVKTFTRNVPSLLISESNEVHQPTTRERIYWAIVISFSIVYLVYTLMVLASWGFDRYARRRDQQAADTSTRLTQVVAFSAGLIIGFATFVRDGDSSAAELTLMSKVRALEQEVTEYNSFIKNDLDRDFMPRILPSNFDSPAAAKTQ